VDSLVNSTWNIVVNPNVNTAPILPMAEPDLGAQSIMDWIASQPSSEPSSEPSVPSVPSSEPSVPSV
jgi:hypothetical protein